MVGKKKTKKKIDKRFHQFCPKGHDTFICGRDKSMGRCLECVRLYHIQYRKKNAIKLRKKNQDYYNKNRRHVKQRTRKWQIKQGKAWKAYTDKYRAEHKKEGKERARKYFQNHKKRILKYRRAHPEIYKLALLKQSKKRGKRIPKFGQNGIRKFYANCPKKEEVDHIIPLLGKLVSGLHVRWNLQYLSQSKNARKNNKVNLEKISIKYSKLLEKLGLK